MDLGSLFLILALLIVVVLFIGRPFMEPRINLGGSAPHGLDEQKLSALLAERDRVINALRELDFDHTVGKIPEEDYPAQRRLLLQQGAELLRQLDARQAAFQPAETKAGPAIELESTAARLGATSDPVLSTARGNGNGYEADDELEALIVSHRRAHQEKATGFCHRCGNPVQGSDRFCPKCGAVLK